MAATGGVQASAFARDVPELVVPWQAAATPEPRILALDDELAAQLGLDPEALRTERLGLLTGTEPPEGITPVAMAYAGHQFGGYSPLLGDGRALLIGDVIDREGHVLELHLKGSGPTPFARGGDGFATVEPMLREHVVSTAMHALGIPTSRSLAVVATGRHIRREGWEPGAVLARVAASHLRVGTFQLARSTREEALLRRLVDHAIARHHPAAADAAHPALALLEAVIAAQAELVAQWMLVGFVHGVMNTDNMTISGETIDYGPCAFMEAYDPETVFSSIDLGGRYAYGQQPAIAAWNLARLAESLLPLLDDDEQCAVGIAQEALARFPELHRGAWLEGMRRRLGLSASDDDGAVGSLADDLVGMLETQRADLTSTMRGLGAAARGDREASRERLGDSFDAWADRWLALAPDADAMDRANPAYVPRNHLVEEALAAAVAGDLAPIERLVDVLRHPFDERLGLERYAEPGPDGDFRAYRTFCGT